MNVVDTERASPAGMTNDSTPLPLPARPKPRLRGVSHEIAAYAAAFAGCYLVAQARGPGTRGVALAATTAYSLCLFFLFAISALYHRPQWSPAARSRMRRLDHSAIALMIAGTATPMVALGLPAEKRALALGIIWAAAIAGLAKSLFWAHAPKPLTAIAYVAMGGSFGFFLPMMSGDIVTAQSGWLLALGGLLYVMGATVYALKRPDPVPAVFGYHEIFHLLVIAAAATHYFVIYQVVAAVALQSGY
jgi:hemolysin III